MTLNEALAISRSSGAGSEAEVYQLVCGFQPLHLATFLKAHLNQVRGIPVDVQFGVYGDMRGNLELAARSSAIGSAVILEWSDLDPRLGLRSSGGWTAATKPDILANCKRSYDYFEAALKRLADRMPVSFCPPNLPLPPIGHTMGTQASAFELELELQVSELLARIAAIPGLRIVQRSRIAAEGPCLDARMEIVAGFPYTLPFASALAGVLAHLLHPPAPKKGLITDLDDTFWSGIVGEIGIDKISWDQGSHTQTHGLYQQMLGHLAGCGVLLGVCSKNEQSTVEAAFQRKDFFMDTQALFPVCANWGPKSASVASVLKAWNINADSVVFIDDNPMELEEVRRTYPGITCLQFAGKHPADVWTLLGQLRDLFGKPTLTAEDQLRQASIRASAQLQELGSEAASPEFLASLQGTVTLEWGVDKGDPRPLELINKTNQFNLNGLRMEAGEWQRSLEQENAVLAVTSYQDKFGPLGKIAVLLGEQRGDTISVSRWVLSCRAFSRRVEHHTLDQLFRQYNAETIDFDFAATERNQPLQEFFQALKIEPDADGVYRLTRPRFLEQCDALPHQISNVRK